MNTIPKLRRRSILQLLGAALVVPFVAPSSGIASIATGPVQMGSFIKINPDGSVLLTVPTFEIGQGSHTSLAMILADELGVNWDDVSVSAPVLDASMNTPGWQSQIVAGSFSVRLWYAPLRQAAATAREMLAAAAADVWSVDPVEISVANSVITHESSGNSAKLFEFVEAASLLTPPEAPTMRADHSLVGRSVPRVDLPGKVNGSAVYGIDVRVPNMVYAAIRHSPTYKGEVVSVDRSGLEGLPGVIDVVRLPTAVMVVAETYWQAKTAVDALEIAFAATEYDAVSTSSLMNAQKLLLDSEDGGVGIDEGDVLGAIAAASEGTDGARIVSADYTTPFLYHAPMEPMTCTASVTDEKCTVWAPTQDLTTATQTAAATAGLEPENVTVHAVYAGGGFGRKYENDFVVQATAASKQVGRPVQLIWSREEDVQHDFFRPAVSARLTGVLEEDGTVSSVLMRLAGQSVIEHSFGIAVLDGVDPVTLLGISTETGHAPGKIQQYSIANERVEYLHHPTHVPVGYWRAVGASHNGFFLESFVDELAYKAGTDPLEFRRRLLKDSPRGLAVLDRVAAAAGWGKPLPDGHFHGIAFSEAVGSILAYVAEVSIDDAGRPAVHKLTIAIDCGMAVHPDSVAAQVVGGAIMGLSAALNEEVRIENGTAQHENFYDYEVLKMADTPEIEAIIMPSDAPPGGVGEAAIPGVAPAVCNAIFAANGKRIRSLPILTNM